MKKTYVTTMPNHIGAFLKASELLAALDINITRVSYNKAVDSHTLFIDAEGEEEALKRAEIELEKIGYLQNTAQDKRIVLLEFKLRDLPGTVADILSLINRYHFNISYISSQENGSDYQLFKMGILVEDADRLSAFLVDAEGICPVRVIDYNRSEKVFDNSIFYDSFISGLTRTVGLDNTAREDLLIYTNLAMQTLDEKGLSPYRTFDSISRFAELLARYKGEAFSPRLSRHMVSEKTEIILIEPPCGSNTAIILSNGEALFVDSGYAIYREEMEKLLRELLPNYDSMKKRIFLTHADVDHGGLLPLFDEIYAGEKTAECLRLEYEGKDGFREQNELHKPYIRMTKLLTSYELPHPDRVKVLWQAAESDEALCQVGFFDFGELHFEVYEGRGGHLPGELVLIDYKHHIAFTGDVYINIRGLTEEQAEYNQYAPILMTSVDTDPKLCALERQAVMQRLGSGSWQIFGAHGAKKCYTVSSEG